jgi:DNA-binding response OmpR family regulator
MMDPQAAPSESAYLTVDIYEHNPVTRELMQNWLTEAGYRVRERSGSQVSADSPVDLVILATQVPTRQTLGLIRVMRKIYPATAFLVLAEHSDSGLTYAKKRARGATRVLSKPLAREELLEAAQAACHRNAIAGGFQLKQRGEHTAIRLKPAIGTMSAKWTTS